MEIILFVVFLISALLATFFTALASVVKHYIVADVLPIVFSIIAEVACLIMLLGAYLLAFMLIVMLLGVFING